MGAALIPILKLVAAAVLPTVASSGAAWLGKKATGASGPAAVGFQVAGALVGASTAVVTGALDSWEAGAVAAGVGKTASDVAYHWWKDRASTPAWRR